MKIIFFACLLLIGIGLLITVIGALLPRAHVVSRSAIYARKPAELFATISDIAASPSWRTGLMSIEVLPPRNGLVCFRENSRHGAITFVVREDISPRKRVTQIADENLPFGGSWTYEIMPESSGSRLRITERGEIKNVLFRFFARFFLGYDGTINAYLRDLGKRFGETVTPFP